MNTSAVAAPVALTLFYLITICFNAQPVNLSPTLLGTLSYESGGCCLDLLPVGTTCPLISVARSFINVFCNTERKDCVRVWFEGVFSSAEDGQTIKVFIIHKPMPPYCSVTASCVAGTLSCSYFSCVKNNLPSSTALTSYQAAHQSHSFISTFKVMDMDVWVRHKAYPVCLTFHVAYIEFWQYSDP